MRASRLLSVLLLLQNRGRMTAEQLSAELEVSVRTVYRDIDALSAAGVPVYADRGRGGGYQLLGGFRTRLTGLTEDEARALSLAGVPEAAAELGLGGVLAAAQLKVAAALPQELRERADTIAQRFHVDVPGWFREVESPRSLTALGDAVWHDRRISVRYQKWDGREVDRVLDPLGLVLKAGRWYLAARSRGRIATYRVSRVLALTATGGGFDRPADFDLPEYWRGWSEQFERRLYPRIAMVRMSPLARDLASFYLGAVGAKAVRDAEEPPDRDGWQRVALPVEAGAPALGELLRFGAELEVLEPDGLRREVADAVRKMGALYD